MAVLVAWLYAGFVCYCFVSNIFDRLFPNRGLAGPAPQWSLFAPKPFRRDLTVVVQPEHSEEWIVVDRLANPPFWCRQRVATLSAAQTQRLLDKLIELGTPPSRSEICERAFLARLLLRNAQGVAIFGSSGLDEDEPELLYKALLKSF